MHVWCVCSACGCGYGCWVSVCVYDCWPGSISLDLWPTLNETFFWGCCQFCSQLMPHRDFEYWSVDRLLCFCVQYNILFSLPCCNHHSWLGVIKELSKSVVSFIISLYVMNELHFHVPESSSSILLFRVNAYNFEACRMELNYKSQENSLFYCFVCVLLIACQLMNRPKS